MNECKHRFDSSLPITATVYVTLYSINADGEPRLRLDLSGRADSLADAVVQATRLAENFKLADGNVWSFHSIEQKCLDCEKLVTFYELKGDLPE